MNYHSIPQKICIVSGHYPDGVLFAKLTRNILEEYAKFHQYHFYYDSDTPVSMVHSELHFRRCLLLSKASEVFSECDWFLWLDTDIYIQNMHRRIEEFIDLSDPHVIYHVFHEKPWYHPVNTGVKFVHKTAIQWENEIYSKRVGCPYPYEQKLVIDYLIPKYGSQIKIHDPEKLNCIYRLHDSSKALFVHVCNYNEVNRNLIILRNTRKLLKDFRRILENKYYTYFYFFYMYYFTIRVLRAIQRRIKFL